MNGELPYSEKVEKRVGPVALEEARLKDNNLDELMSKLPGDTDQDLISIIRRATKLIPSDRANLNEIETSLELLLNYTKISFEEMSNENAAADWMQINVSGDVEILLKKKEAMIDFTDFSKSAFLDSSLPENLSIVGDKIRNWVFLQCQEGASLPRSGNWQFLVACCYNWGFGIEWSKESTFEWLSRAAETNNTEAQCMLGEFYLSGVVVKANTSEAIRLFTLAVNARNARAMYLLGLCYYNDQGTARDNKRAIDLWKKAEKAGVVEAAERLDSESSFRRRFSFKKLFRLDR